MSHHASNEKRLHDDEPQMVSATFVTASPSEDQQAAQSIDPDTIHVVVMDDETDVQQQRGSSSSQHRHHQQGQQATTPRIAQQEPATQGQQQSELDPTAIRIVTFDEEPESSAIDNDTVQQESAPLLNSSINIVRSGEVLYGTNDDDEEEYGGAECHNVTWAILFWSHMAVVFYCGMYLAPKGFIMSEEDGFDLQQLHDLMQRKFLSDSFTRDDLDMLIEFLKEVNVWLGIYPTRIMWFAWFVGIVSFVLNLIRNHFFIKARSQLFVASNLVILGITIGLCLLILLSDSGFGGFVIAAAVFGLLAFYIYKHMWPKVQFAALNLEIAMTGIGNNLGIWFYIFGILELTIFWIAFWFYTFGGMMQYVTGIACPNWEFDPESDEDQSCHPSNLVLLALLLSHFWTIKYVLNTVQVYVAGVMATWCYEKDAAKGICSIAVTSSMYRSLVYSSGPIAFGSLLEGVCKFLRSILSHSNRNPGRNQHVVYDMGDDCRCCCCGLCGMVLECLSALLGDVLDYFSQWAYCFVGINGTSYLESGKSAMHLFQTRGWSVLITDRVVGTVLGVGILEGGVMSGLITIGLERMVTWSMYPNDHTDLPPSYIFGPPANVVWISFMFGFIVGSVVSGIMMNVVHGAVNTLIVCWAESPESFQENHKYWADQMTAVWSSAYPGTQEQQPPPANDNGSNVASQQWNGYGATDTTPM